MSQDGETVKEKPPNILYVNPNKKYGLIIQNKKPAATSITSISQVKTVQKTLVKPCIFDQDDDDDDEDDKQDNKLLNQKRMLNVNTSESRIRKQTQIDIEKALKEDANIFEYDAIYDKLEEEKNKLDPKLKNKTDSKEPKYIAGLMKAAARRQMDFEKLQDRKIQKEREQEGDLWSDKEVFVTTAYKKKLEERQRLEEEEKNQEAIEKLLDVRKQKDLSGFYSSLLKMKSGEMVIEEEGEKERREKEAKFKESSKAGERDKSQPQKSYRNKKEESSSEEEEEVQVSEEVKVKEEKIDETSESFENKDADLFKEPLPKKSKADEEKENVENKNSDTDKVKSEEVKVEEEPKLSKEEARRLRREKLFTKRTVGEKFDEELADYFKRKSEYLSLKTYIERE